ncbi:MAG: fibronectin type III domain-containing protein, partial [Oscillospiraceae bacterium]
MNGQESEKNLKGKTPVDFTNPSKPRNIEAFGVTANEASLRWTAASDNRDIIGNISYRVYDGDKIVSEG